MKKWEVWIECNIDIQDVEAETATIAVEKASEEIIRTVANQHPSWTISLRDGGTHAG